MKFESTSALMLDETGSLSIAQLVEQSGLTEADLQVLVECGALLPHVFTLGTDNQRDIVMARVVSNSRVTT